MKSIMYVCFVSLGLFACTKKDCEICANQSVRIEMDSRSNSSVRGFVELKELSSNRLEISGLIENLSPGEHGFHVHEIGDCSAADASSAGGHFGHSHEKHGGLGHKDRHAGDLGNIVANSDGVAVFKIEAEKLCFRSTSCSVLGRSLVVHEDPDDLSSQPAGNSGARQACGVIPKSCCVN